MFHIHLSVGFVHFYINKISSSLTENQPTSLAQVSFGRLFVFVAETLNFIQDGWEVLLHRQF